MALTPEKILLFLGGLAVAGGGTAYVAGVFDPYLKSPAVSVGPAAKAPEPKMAALPPKQETPAPATGQRVAAPEQPAAQPPAKAPAETSPAAKAPAETQPAAAEPTAKTEPETATKGETPAAKPSGMQPPSFDLVRVEADGSIVIAGKAAPKSKVEILSGSRVVGMGEAGDEGDFAIVIDEPLKPGDYQLVLRATGADAIGAMSAETAVVSIPETLDGQVLALVEEPGKASQLITVPKAEKSGADAAKTAPQPPAAASTPPDATPRPAGTDTATGETKPDAPKATDNAGAMASAAPTPATTKPAATSGGAASTDASPTKPQTGTFEPAAADVAKADQAPAAAATTGDQAKVEPKPSAPTDTATKPEAAPAMASAEPAPVAPSKTSGAPHVAVEAVEIEGRTIFVAGSGTPGSHIRAYANDILLGDDTVSPGGRFLVQAERELKVGDYIIRIDVLGPDGVKVLSRAAVPFAREAGESIAAVAPPAATANTKAADATGQNLATEPKAPAEADVAAAVAQKPAPPSAEATNLPKAANTAEQKNASAATTPSAAQPETAKPSANEPAPAASNAPSAPQPTADAAEQKAATAESPTASQPEATKPSASAPASVSEPSTPPKPSDAGQTAANAEPAPATPQREAAEPAATAESPSAQADASTDKAQQPATGNATTDEAAASPAPAAEQPKPSEHDVAAKTPAVVQPPAESDAKPAMDADADPSTGTDTASSPATPPTEEPSAQANAASPTEPMDGAEIMAPKLQSVDGAVIIRRGDTLWRISRRVYGLGTRYSTIYLANQPQIEDPDRIWPGQVFSVPRESKEGEQADLGQLGDQQVAPAQD